MVGDKDLIEKWVVYGPYEMPNCQCFCAGPLASRIGRTSVCAVMTAQAAELLRADCSIPPVSCTSQKHKHIDVWKSMPGDTTETCKIKTVSVLGKQSDELCCTM